MSKRLEAPRAVQRDLSLIPKSILVQTKEEKNRTIKEIETQPGLEVASSEVITTTIIITAAAVIVVVMMIIDSISNQHTAK